MGKTLSFDIVKTNENFIQLLHVGSLHWVCVANLSENKSHNGEGQLDDSLSNGKVSPDVAKQIAAFSFCDLPEILVGIKGVQQQTNSFDCDLFAIVFATSLAFGEGPANVTHDFMKLRMHLIKCLDEKQMTCFSKSTEKHVSKCQSRLAAIELYYKCRMPYNKYVSCENMLAKLFDSKYHSEIWHCYNCANKIL